MNQFGLKGIKGKRPATRQPQAVRTTMQMKVADLNSMVQIRKRAPAKTYKER